MSNTHYNQLTGEAVPRGVSPACQTDLASIGIACKVSCSIISRFTEHRALTAIEVCSTAKRETHVHLYYTMRSSVCLSAYGVARGEILLDGERINQVGRIFISIPDDDIQLEATILYVCMYVCMYVEKSSCK